MVFPNFTLLRLYTLMPSVFCAVITRVDHDDDYYSMPWFAVDNWRCDVRSFLLMHISMRVYACNIAEKRLHQIKKKKIFHKVHPSNTMKVCPAL